MTSNMRYRRPFLLAALLAAALASTIAWSRPRPDRDCPRSPVQDGAPCKQKHATCRWACEHEDQRDLACDCEKNDSGAWRWSCRAVGQICRK